MVALPHPSLSSFHHLLKDDAVLPVLAASSESSMQPELRSYADAMANDPVGKCCEIVNACRHSGQRHRRLQAVLEAGNANGYWRGKLPDGGDKIPVLRLLRDCPTRWSSTFKMIDRVLMLYPVSNSNFSIQTFTYALHL
jgi:hypothetical protein